MRVVAKNTDIRVKAYAGVTGVLLALDLVDETKKTGLLGFAIQKKTHGFPPTGLPASATDGAMPGFRWLNGMLVFPGQPHNPGDPVPTNLGPIQKFRWSDYAVSSATTYTYGISPVYGAPGKLKLDPPLEVTVTTGTWDIPEMLKVPNKQYALFNRAAAASQAFAREFSADNNKMNAALKQNAGKPAGKKKVPDPSPAALAWLSRGVKEGIVQFVEQAKDSTMAIDVAIYQYELPEIVQAVNDAFKRKVVTRLIYHAKPGDKQTTKNQNSAKLLPKADKVGRVTSAIFHHKFIVLSNIKADGTRQPIAVLAGSTNFTFNGVYAQANDLYVSTDPAIAQKYLEQFEKIFAGETVAETKARDTAQNIYDPAAILQVGYSPRTGKKDLGCFVTLINSAKQDVLFSTAFNLEQSISDALDGDPHDDILRYGVQDKASKITGTHADRTAQFTAAAMLPTGLEGWLHEQHVKGQTGNILIHTKCIIVDFTSDHPIVMSGSHNYSTNASQSNDENVIVTRDDIDLADNFGCEIMRIYDGYRFRFVAKTDKKKPVPPKLTANDSWLRDYFDPKTLKHADRVVFAGTIANQGASASVHVDTAAPTIQKTRAKARAIATPKKKKLAKTVKLKAKKTTRSHKKAA